MSKTSKKNTVDSGSAPTETKVITAPFEGHLEDNPDFKEFLEICKMTGQLTQEYGQLSLEDKKSIEVGFHQWIKAEKPKPTMPELPKAKIEYPIDVWIAKSKGKTFVFYDTNLGKKHWVEENRGRYIKFDTEATSDVITKLLQEREELCPLEQPRHQYVMIGTQVHLIQDETDILKPYDELVQIARKGSTP